VADEWEHLVVLVEALVSAGNEVVGAGFTPNQGGWNCEMRRPLDFELIVPLANADAHDVRVDQENDRVDCLHCWAGIHGPL
jgi:hypothetical protein